MAVLSACRWLIHYKKSSFEGAVVSRLLDRGPRDAIIGRFIMDGALFYKEKLLLPQAIAGFDGRDPLWRSETHTLVTR
jgi:hypothetical protein